jgi:hypothetical protein
VFSLASVSITITFTGLDDGLKGNPTSFMQALERHIPLNECLQVDFDKTICSRNFLVPKLTLTKLISTLNYTPRLEVPPFRGNRNHSPLDKTVSTNLMNHLLNFQVVQPRTVPCGSMFHHIAFLRTYELKLLEGLVN